MQPYVENQETKTRNSVNRGIHEFQVYKIWRKLNIHYSSKTYNAYQNKKLGGNQLSIEYYADRVREKGFYRALGKRVSSKVEILKGYVGMVETGLSGFIHISDVDFNQWNKMVAIADDLTTDKARMILVHDSSIIRKHGDVWKLLMERRIRLFTASYLYHSGQLDKPDNDILYCDLYQLVQKHAEHFKSGRFLHNPIFGV